MQIILIQPPFSKAQVREVFHPMHLLQLGSYVGHFGFKSQIVDFELLCKNHPALYHDFFNLFRNHIPVEDESPVFGFTAMNSNLPYALEMSKRLKAEFPRASIVLGGAQATLTAKLLLQKYPWIDAVVRNEGEKTFHELCQAIQSGQKDLSGIQGLTFQSGQDVIQTPDRPFMDNLDDLPMTDLDLIDFSAYPQDQDPPSFPLVVGYGCPYACSFCSTSVMWKRRYRVKSPQRIMREISAVRDKYQVSNFAFTHDNLFFNRKYVRQLAEQCFANGIRWSGSSRLDHLDEEMIDFVATRGCKALFLGIETGSPVTQKAINKNVDLSHLAETVAYAAGKNLFITASFIIGFPEEDLGSIEDSLAAALKARLAGAGLVQVHPLSPVPGTRYIQMKLVPNGRMSTSHAYRVSDDADQLLCSYMSDPEICSSYFHIENSGLSYETLFGLATFYHNFINALPRTIFVARSFFDSFQKTYNLAPDKMISFLIEDPETISEQLKYSFPFDEKKLAEPELELLKTVFKIEMFRRKKAKQAPRTDGTEYSLNPNAMFARSVFDIEKLFARGLIDKLDKETSFYVVKSDSNEKYRVGRISEVFARCIEDCPSGEISSLRASLAARGFETEVSDFASLVSATRNCGVLI